MSCPQRHLISNDIHRLLETVSSLVLCFNDELAGVTDMLSIGLRHCAALGQSGDSRLTFVHAATFAKLVDVGRPLSRSRDFNSHGLRIAFAHAFERGALALRVSIDTESSGFHAMRCRV